MTGDRQLARWAAYPTRQIFRSAVICAAVGAAVHVLVGYALFDRHAPLDAALAGALWFGLGMFVFVGATLAWTRHRARHGRRAWWLTVRDD